MIIDSHQHVFWHKRDDAGLIQDMDEHGIDLAWLLSWEIPSGQYDAAYDKLLNPLNFAGDQHQGILLRDLIQADKAYPGRFVLGYCPDPASGRAADLFEAAYHVHRVRVCGEWKFRMLFDDPRCIELYRRAGSLGCPVVLHLDVPYLKDEQGHDVYQPHWYGGAVANLERALQQCPQTNFIGHAPGFWREISGDADDSSDPYPSGPIAPGGRIYHLLDAYPNLYADLSAGSALRALKRDPEVTNTFLIRYADKLLFGRDIYGGELLTYLQSQALPRLVMEKIFCNNATALVGGGR
jgi:predicted TIM-barrel fold metal-dependent hydrolase